MARSSLNTTMPTFPGPDYPSKRPCHGTSSSTTHTSQSNNSSSTAPLIDLTRSSSPQSFNTPSSPHFEIPSAFQQLRARKFAHPLNPSRPPKEPAKRVHHSDNQDSTQTTSQSIDPVRNKPGLSQARHRNSPDQITLSCEPIDLTLDEDNLTIFQDIPIPFHTLRRKSRNRLAAVTLCLEPIDLTADDEDFETPRKNDSIQRQQKSPVAEDHLNRPASRCSSELESSDSDAELVESILLDRPPLKSQPPKSPPPLRFLPSDLKHLNIYLSKPISRVLTTCSSVAMPPRLVPGFPLDSLEKTCSEDPWKIKREIIRCPGPLAQSVECWISGYGWPARSFVVCGWLVGIDRREKFLSYYVDDGTAVVECQLVVSQLNKVFDCSSENAFNLTSAAKKKCLTGSANDGQEDIPSNPCPVVPKADPLDKYRRLPSPIRQAHAGSSKAGAKNSALIETNKAAEMEVTEETISKYSTLPIGITLKLAGRPKDLFRNTKRVLDIEKALIVQETDEDAEIEFRNQLHERRSRVYNEPFRLASVWPESVQFSNNQNAPKKDFDKQTAPERKEPQRLKLAPISKLKPNQITFVNYLNYLTHYIMMKYDDLGSSSSTPRKPIDYHKLKEKISKSENVNLAEEFFLDDLFGDHNPTKTKSALDQERQDLNLFIEKLIQRKPQEDGSQAPGGADHHKPKKTIFLTDETDGRAGQKLTKEAIMRRAIQALINQGTIVISPHNEAGFTVPSPHSLGPKVVKIILDRPAPASAQNPSPRSLVSVDYILRTLRRDQLWKNLGYHHVVRTLTHLNFSRISPDSWAVP